MTLPADWDTSTHRQRRYFSTITKLPSSSWSFIPGIGLVSTGTGGSGTVTIPLGPFNPRESIQGFGVRIKPSSGHSSLPSTMPRWRLYQSSPSLTPASPIASAIDGSANLATYETVHTIESDFVNSPVWTDGSFWLEFDDEVSPISAMILVDVFAVVGSGPV